MKKENHFDIKEEKKYDSREHYMNTAEDFQESTFDKLWLKKKHT